MSKQKWRRRNVPRWLVRCAPHQAIGGLIPPDVCFGAGCRPEDLISLGLSSPCYGGTEGSNPSPSSRESVSLPHPLSKVENPGFPRGCARLAWRAGRQRRAERFDLAPTGGNISVAPYSSTAVPLMWWREC